ncbi:MAG: glycosyltransferase family 2 protein [Dehalococcoidia bacterium]|nr:glycosyltransferase family 2 protein [Dehalococcoidia bacterium]
MGRNAVDMISAHALAQVTLAQYPAGEPARGVRIMVGIPCLNEERSIGEIVRKARQYAEEVIVVDDGSTDRTAQVAEAAGATVVRHGVNKGYAAALNTCFAEARNRRADIMVTLDGDAQHDPSEISCVINPVLAGKADVVIGSRFKASHEDMPAYRKIGIAVITWLCNVGSSVQISDAQSGFRAYGHKAIQTLNSREQGMNFSVDALIQAREKKLRIAEVPISCIYNADCHSANPVTHGLGVALAVIRIRAKNFIRRPIRGSAVDKPGGAIHADSSRTV